MFTDVAEESALLENRLRVVADLQPVERGDARDHIFRTPLEPRHQEFCP